MGLEEPLADFDLCFEFHRCQVTPELLPVVPIAEIPEEENGIVLPGRLPEGCPVLIHSFLDRRRMGYRTILIGVWEPGCNAGSNMDVTDGDDPANGDDQPFLSFRIRFNAASLICVPCRANCRCIDLTLCRNASTSLSGMTSQISPRLQPARTIVWMTVSSFCEYRLPMNSPCP